MAVLTNLSREHTDWHGSEQQYRADKLRIFDLPGFAPRVRPPGERGGLAVSVRDAPEQIPLRGPAQRRERRGRAWPRSQAAGLPAAALPRRWTD